MAKASKTPAATATVVPIDQNSAQSYTISQQALNVLIQLINAKGWAETLQDAYIGGKLVTKYLPALESTEWLLTNEQLSKLSAEELAAYRKRDEEWGAKRVTFQLTAKQLEATHKAFKHFIGELIKNKALGPLPVFNELIEELNIEVEGLELDKD
jgi:hypothetical protein